MSRHLILNYISIFNRKQICNRSRNLSYNMGSRTLIDLNSLSKEKVKEFIDSFDTVLTDCDGVLWLQTNAIEGSPNVLNKLRDMGKKIFYVTNNSTKFKEDFIIKARNLGFKCNEEEMISTSSLAARYLKEKNIKKAYIVGSIGISKELDQVGIQNFGIGPDPLNTSLGEYVKTFSTDPEVGAVVVGFDEHISYVKLLKAASYLANPYCLFVATNTDESFPASNNLVLPGTGTFVSAIATCSGRTPIVLGKPNTTIVEGIMKDYNLNPKRTIMIGDRCNTDILLGTRCGFQTFLVLSGVTTLEDAIGYKNSINDKDLVADVYLPKLGDLLPYLD